MQLKLCFQYVRIFLITLLSINAVAQGHDDSGNILNDSINFERYVLEDKTGSLTFQDVTSKKINSQFRRPVTSDLITTKGAYWIKFAFKNNFAGTVFLETRPTHKSATLFIPLDSGKYAVQKDGFNYSFRNKKLKVSSTIFPIEDNSKQNYYYLRIELSSFWGPSFFLRSYENIFNTYISKYFFNGLMLGFIFFTCLYGLVFWILIKEKAYLFYTCYVLSFALFIITDKDFEVYFTQFISIRFGGFFYSIPFSLMTIFLLLYAQSILNTKQYLLKFHNLLTGFIIIKIIFVFAGNLTDIYIFNNPVFDNSFIFVAFVAAFFRFRQGFKPARYVVLGLSVILLGVFFQGLRYTFHQSNAYWDFFSIENVCIGEIILFYFALASRVKTLKAEKENAFLEAIHRLEENEVLQKEIINQLQVNEQLKEKVNSELEEKVRLRTIQISEMAAEIEKMNQLLKAENINLDSNVKKLSKARVMQNPVSFEEFRNIYPNEDACYKFLVDLKWGKGYICRKCANTKFYVNAGSPYIHVCSVCKYAESPTASTIFNKLKFPIEKAFYMLFLLSTGKKITSEQLSTYVGLRMQTCWMFKKKVLEVMEKTNHLKNKSSDWSHLILN